MIKFSNGTHEDQGVLPGGELWRQNVDFLINEIPAALRLRHLTVGVPIPVLMPSGRPKAFVTTITVPGPEVMFAGIAFGYEPFAGGILEEPTGVLPVEKLQATAQFATDTGEYIEGTFNLIPVHNLTLDGHGASIDGAWGPHVDGWVQTQKVEVFSALWRFTFNDFMLPPYRIPPLSGGVFGLEVIDHVNYASEIMDSVDNDNVAALTILRDHLLLFGDPEETVQRAFDIVRRGVPALERAVMTNLIDGAEDGDIAQRRVDAVAGILPDAILLQKAAKARLLGEPTALDLARVINDLEDVNNLVGRIQSLID